MECYFCKKNIDVVSFRDTTLLRSFVSGLGKIRASKRTGVCATHQRKVSRAIKQARQLGILSPTSK